jgi:hypothetical protein
MKMSQNQSIWRENGRKLSLQRYLFRQTGIKRG